MHKSFVERIFPHSSPVLPQHERSTRQSASLHATPTSSSTKSSHYNSRARQLSPLARSSIQTPPLAASIVHHADPLLPIDRAAKSLERHIQQLLDAQSEGLSAGLENGVSDDLSSTGSLTPTPSASTPWRRSTTPRVIPVRQPVQKGISLRESRKGLKRSMQDFVTLKNQEFLLLKSQASDRNEALIKAQALSDKKTALEREASSAKAESNSAEAESLKLEAGHLENDIRELEDRLFEMKANHRRLLEQAGKLESSVDSKLSSYKSSIAMVDMEIRKFLIRPPLLQSLPDAIIGPVDSGMYALKPERRTIEMAKDQWTSEQKALAQRAEDVHNERLALEQGGKMWDAAVQKINAFEKKLRAQTRAMSESQIASDTSAAQSLFAGLTALLESLEADYSQAESNSWNLLICALGAELEALRQGRNILERTLGIMSPVKSQINGAKGAQDASHPGLIEYGKNANGGVLNSPGADSNRSLEDTLQEFEDPGQRAEKVSSTSGTGRMTGSWKRRHTPSSSVSKSTTGRSDLGLATGLGVGPQLQTADAPSESEDDDPGPEFLLSH